MGDGFMRFSARLANVLGRGLYGQWKSFAQRRKGDAKAAKKSASPTRHKAVLETLLCVFASAFAPLRELTLSVRSRAARAAAAWCPQRTSSRRRVVDDARWAVEMCTKQSAPVARVLHRTPCRRSAPQLFPCRD